MRYDWIFLRVPHNLRDRSNTVLAEMIRHAQSIILVCHRENIEGDCEPVQVH